MFFFATLHQEKTASGKTRSDLMKNKRNKVVSKKQNAAGKKAYANILTTGGGSCTMTSSSNAGSKLTANDRVEVQQVHSLDGYANSGMKENSTSKGEGLLMETLFVVLREGKQALLEKISDLSVKELLGTKWTEVSLALSFELHMIMEQHLVHFVGKAGDLDLEIKQNMVCFQAEILKQISDYVRLYRFLEIKGVVCNKQLLFQDEDEADHSEEKAEIALGNSEDETRDDQMPWNTEVAAEVRGGMRTFYNKDAALLKIEERRAHEQEGVRGGAGGSATTAKKQQIRDALKEMASMVNDLPETQEGHNEEDEVLDKIMRDMSNLAESWKQKKPNKDQLKQKLSHLTERLDKSIKASATASSGGGEKDGPMQSFYSNFDRNFQSLARKPEGKSAGKGKGGKNKQTEVMRTLPRFDLRKAWPQKEMTTWHIVLRDLENGKEPQGAIALCDSVDRLVEIQTLAKAHAMAKSIILVAKAENSEAHKNVVNPKECLLPWQGNLAMSKAIVATSDGKAAGLDGITPIKAKETKVSEEKKTALRILAVMKFVEPSSRDKLVQFPDLSLHLLGCLDDLKECKTYGWTHDEDENVLVWWAIVASTLLWFPNCFQCLGMVESSSFSSSRISRLDPQLLGSPRNRESLMKSFLQE